MIVFSATAVNHLGLVAAMEGIIGRRLPVIGCPKCLAFWTTLAYALLASLQVPTATAVAFLSAWSATWLDLLMGLTDRLYLFIYDKIYPAADTAGAGAPGTPDAVPGMPGEDASGTGGEETGS